MLALSPMLNVSSPFAVVSVRVFADASTLLIVPLTVAAVAFATRAAAAGAAMMLTAPRPRLAAIAAARKLTFIVRLHLATTGVVKTCARGSAAGRRRLRPDFRRETVETG